MHDRVLSWAWVWFYVAPWSRRAEKRQEVKQTQRSLQFRRREVNSKRSCRSVEQFDTRVLRNRSSCSHNWKRWIRRCKYRHVDTGSTRTRLIPVRSCFRWILFRYSYRCVQSRPLNRRHCVDMVTRGRRWYAQHSPDEDTEGDLDAYLEPDIERFNDFAPLWYDVIVLATDCGLYERRLRGKLRHC